MPANKRQGHDEAKGAREARRRRTASPFRLNKGGRTLVASLECGGPGCLSARTVPQVRNAGEWDPMETSGTEGRPPLTNNGVAAAAWAWHVDEVGGFVDKALPNGRQAGAAGCGSPRAMGMEESTRLRLLETLHRHYLAAADTSSLRPRGKLARAWNSQDSLGAVLGECATSL